MMDQHHYTLEQVEEHVRDAVSLVERLEVPEDLRPAALTAAISMLSNKTIVQGAPTLLPMGGRLQ